MLIRSPSPGIDWAHLAPQHSTTFRAAFESILPELNALSEAELVPITADIPQVFTILTGAVVRLEAIHTELCTLPGIEQDCLDRLSVYTRALAHAHAQCMLARAPRSHLPALLQAAAQQRAILCTDARALIARGVLPARCLRKLRARKGYRNTAFDLLALSALFRRHWQAVGDNSGVSLAELHRAETAAEQLLTEIGLREHGPAVRQQAAEHRQRAFTVVARHYAQLRRATRYLCGTTAEANALAPTIYPKKRKPAARIDKEPDTPSNLNPVQPRPSHQGHNPPTYLPQDNNAPKHIMQQGTPPPNDVHQVG